MNNIDKDKFSSTIETNFKVVFYSEEPEYSQLFNQCFSIFPNKNRLLESLHIHDLSSLSFYITSTNKCNYFNIAIKNNENSILEKIGDLLFQLPHYHEIVIIIWSKNPSELIQKEWFKNNFNVDIRDINMATSEWIEWVNYLNINNHLNRIHTQKIDEIFESGEEFAIVSD